MLHKKYRFIKDLVKPDVVYKKEDTLTVINNNLFYNDMMISPAFYEELMNLIDFETNNGWNYLREVKIEYVPSPYIN